MALNPPLIPGGTLPLPVNGETFVLQRKGILLDADIQVRRALGRRLPNARSESARESLPA